MSLTIRQSSLAAQRAKRSVAAASGEERNDALRRIADYLLKYADEIERENEKDTAAARERGMKKSLVDRLILTRDRIEAIAASVREITLLPDPIGEVIEKFTLFRKARRERRGETFPRYPYAQEATPPRCILQCAAFSRLL